MIAFIIVGFGFIVTLIWAVATIAVLCEIGAKLFER